MSAERDLTLVSTTFPDLPDPQILRDNLISLLHDRFGRERKVIVVQGPVGAGKTTLLAQFAKTFPDRCFTFFAGTTLPTSHPRYFLLDLCEQMAKALRRSTERLEELDTDGLKQLFLDLYRSITRESRFSRDPFYYIVDGLEWIPMASQEQTILDLLPAEPRSNIRLLASSDPSRTFRFLYDRWDIPFFASRDTEIFLTDLGLTKEDIQRIHKSCHGMPGYLAAIRRLMESGVTLEELPSKLPDELRGLFAIEWDRMNVTDENLLMAFAVLGYSKEPLTLDALKQILGAELEDLRQRIRKASFLRIDPKDQAISFVSDAYKQFVADRLRSIREQAEGLLLKYYARDPYTKASLVLLPRYLATANSYENLKSLVTSDYLIRALDSSRDITVLRRTLQLTADQAYKAEDWLALFKYTLASSILRTISDSPVSEAEVEALLGLGDYESAFKTAYQSLLAEDRLQLLARVCTRMQEAGLSVPESVLTELEQMASAIDPAALKERALEIAAVLFDLLPGAAIDLVERSAGGIAGERSLDIARALLAVRLETKPSEVLRSRITDQVLRDFTRALSPRAAKLTPHEVIAESEKINTTSGKLSLLSAWCNENRKNPSANEVVEKALEIVTGDPSYSPSMRFLRKLAEPLKASTPSSVKKLIERLDLLKGTALKKPVEEAFRFDLLLADLEARESRERGLERLLESYFDLDNVSESDIRCYCLARLLISLPQIDPDNSLHMKEEIEKQLIREYDILLEGSADHWAVTKRIIRAVTSYNPDLASKFATKLNTSGRRDSALHELMYVYVGTTGQSTDLSFIEMILRNITSNDTREVTLVRLIERFAELGLLAELPESRRFLEEIKHMQSCRNQCYACAFALSALESNGEGSLPEKLRQQLLSSVANVDAKWERVRLGMDVAVIVAKRNAELARLLLEQARGDRATSPLAEKFFADIFINCLRLALRAFSGVVACDPNYKTSKDHLLQMIRYVPSHGIQCELVADLALRHHLADKYEEFAQLIREEVEPYLNDCSDQETKVESLVKIAPHLYEYDAVWTFEQLRAISRSRRNDALENIFNYVLTRIAPGDPIDLDSVKIDIDPKRARQICQVIGEMNYDSQMCHSIDHLVNALVQRDPHDPKREVCVSLIERDALDIAQRLEDIVSAKLPDPYNISHNGYLIAGKAAITRLRAAAQWRMKTHLPWSNIAKDARAVPNIADRVFVLSWVGRRMYPTDISLGRSLLNEAEELVPKIPNLLDRADRLHVIARSMNKADDAESAKSLLQQAMSVLKACSRGRDRDSIVGDVLQLAHSIDSEFASNIAPLVDNPIEEHLRMLDLIAGNLQRDPNKLHAEKEREIHEVQYIVSQSAWRMLESLNSGVGHVRHPREVGQWLREMVDGDFETSFKVTAWSLENTLRQTKQLDLLVGLYERVLDSLRLCMAVGHVLLGIRARTLPIINLALPENVRLFRTGRRAEALLTLQSWLGSVVKGYVKIYDPYFNVADLHILKFIEPECQVYIVTSWRAQKGITPGDRSVQQLYQDAWNQLSDKSPPWTQVTIVGTRSGDSPLHSRYIITEGKGLALGTSIGGLGLKDSELHILEPGEAFRIENEFVDPQFGPQLRLYKGERLIVHIFVL